MLPLIGRNWLQADVSRSLIRAWAAARAKTGQIGMAAPDRLNPPIRTGHSSVSLPWSAAFTLSNQV